MYRASSMFAGSARGPPGFIFYFNRLPLNVQELIIKCACQQLGQLYQYGTIPRVNHHWHSVALSTCKTLEAKVDTRPVADSLKTWLLKHGHGLTHFTLSNTVPLFLFTWNLTDDLFFTVTSVAPQLRSLNMIAASPVSTQRLTALTDLTNLQLRVTDVKPPLLQLTELRSLSLRFGHNRPPARLFGELATSLQLLTSLRLSLPPQCIDSDFGALSSSTSLQQLELSVGKPLHLHQLQYVRDLPCTALAVHVTPAPMQALPMAGGPGGVEGNVDYPPGVRDLEEWLQLPMPREKLRNVAVSYGAPWQGPGYLVSRHSATWAPGLVSVLVTAVTGLEELSLRGIKVTGSSVKDLSLLPRLVTLKLSHCDVAGSVEVLQQLTVLTGLRSLTIEEGLGRGDTGSSSSREHERHSMIDMVLDLLLGKLPKLEHLGVNGWAAKLTPITK